VGEDQEQEACFSRIYIDSTKAHTIGCGKANNCGCSTGKMGENQAATKERRLRRVFLLIFSPSRWRGIGYLKS
jgi:hypothetical protein